MNHLRGLPREQKLLLPEAVEDYVAAEAPVRFIDAFVGTLDFRARFRQSRRGPLQRIIRVRAE